MPTTVGTTPAGTRAGPGALGGVAEFGVSNQAEDISADPVPVGDARLVTLLELWDRLEEDGGQPNSLGMTVLVGGVTYSGLLVPARTWARHMADLLQSAGQGNQVGAIGGLFEEVAQAFQGTGGKASDVTDYLHLANVALGLPADGKRTSLLMRIRVSDVSAWTIGTIGELPSFPPPVTDPSPAAR